MIECSAPFNITLWSMEQRNNLETRPRGTGTFWALPSGLQTIFIYWTDLLPVVQTIIKSISLAAEKRYRTFHGFEWITIKKTCQGVVRIVDKEVVEVSEAVVERDNKVPKLQGQMAKLPLLVNHTVMKNWEQTLEDMQEEKTAQFCKWGLCVVSLWALPKWWKAGFDVTNTAQSLKAFHIWSSWLKIWELVRLQKFIARTLGQCSIEGTQNFIQCISVVILFVLRCMNCHVPTVFHSAVQTVQSRRSYGWHNSYLIILPVQTFIQCSFVLHTIQFDLGELHDIYDRKMPCNEAPYILGSQFQCLWYTRFTASLHFLECCVQHRFIHYKIMTKIRGNIR